MTMSAANADIATLTTPHVPDDWSDVDARAVDTARILAADAVQKVGNGHPGTAMSLAPLAYTLFQRVMRHDPADPHWVGRDRFVLSCGHSASPCTSSSTWPVSASSSTTSRHCGRGAR